MERVTQDELLRLQNLRDANRCSSKDKWSRPYLRWSLDWSKQFSRAKPLSVSSLRGQLREDGQLSDFSHIGWSDAYLQVDQASQPLHLYKPLLVHALATRHHVNPGCLPTANGHNAGRAQLPSLVT